MILHTDHWHIASLKLMHHLTSLPTIQHQIPARITRRHNLTIRTHTDINIVTRAIVSAEYFLVVLANLLSDRETDDFIVLGLVDDEILFRMRAGACQGVHIARIVGD